MATLLPPHAVGKRRTRTRPYRQGAGETIAAHSRISGACLVDFSLLKCPGNDLRVELWQRGDHDCFEAGSSGLRSGSAARLASDVVQGPT